MDYIKFRFWIGNRPVIRSLSSFIFNDGTKEQILNGFANHFNVDRFTGCVDDLGNDIYEGDILYFSYGIPGRNVFAEVVYKWAKYYCMMPGHNPDKIGLNDILHMFSCEIVGNVYQNKDLING